jgi:hypothetical protein
VELSKSLVADWIEFVYASAVAIFSILSLPENLLTNVRVFSRIGLVKRVGCMSGWAFPRGKFGMGRIIRRNCGKSRVCVLEELENPISRLTSNFTSEAIPPHMAMRTPIALSTPPELRLGALCAAPRQGEWSTGLRCR